MDDYEAACVRLEKISTAVQKAKDNLKCSICLDLFDEPVTIKCGHRFCRQCILRVTNNENSCCPNCNKKIQKRSIPKKGEAVVEACVKQFKDLIKSIQSDSGIDVLQPQNKVKHTKESTFDFEKPSTSKVHCTPSTSKGSSFSVNTNLSKPKVSNPVRSRLSLTKKKADTKSPSQSSDKNTLHKYLSNKSDPVSDQVAQSQEKVKNWLESCTSDDHDSEATESMQAQSKNLKDVFNVDQLTPPPEQIYCSPQGDEIQESDVSPVPPPSEASSESKYKATQMRIQEAEEMARKKKMSLSLKEKGDMKEKSNVRTPSSVPASSHPDALDWRRVKQVGREMQVKTFKTLNVSIEKISPAVALDDTVPYNSTNNDSKNFSRDSEMNNSSVDKTPLHMRQKDPLKSENNNLSKKSPRIVIEDYRQRSMDSSGSSKQEYVAAVNVDENQLNEIIGVVPSTSVEKTPEEVKASLKLRKRSHSSPKLNQESLSKRRSSNDQELSDNESTNFASMTTAVDLKKSRLSLKKSVVSTDSKNSSPSSSPNKESKSIKKSLDYSSPEKLKRRLSSGLNQVIQNKTSNITQKLATINHPSSSNLANNSLTSLSKCCRIVFKKLGRTCKKKKNTPFLYLGKLNRKNCIFFDGTSSTKPIPVIKSSVPVQIDYKSMMDDKNVANLEDFSSGDSHSKLISPKSNLQSKLLQSDLQSKSPSRCSPVHNYEEPMNVDNDLDVNRLSPSNQQMEIDETLPPAQMNVQCDNKLETINSDCNMNDKKEDKDADFSPKTSREVSKHLEDKETEEIPSSINDNAPQPSTSAYQDNMPKKSKTKVKTCSPIPECSSNVDTVKKSSSRIQAKVLTTKNTNENTDMGGIPEDLISISSDDSEKVLRKDKKQEVKQSSTTKNDSSRRRGQTRSKKSDLESCTDSEVSLASSKRGKVNVAKQAHSSTSSSSLKTVKKKRTHSESSEDDVGNIIDKWFDNDSDKVTKKAKISLDSEEMVNVSKRRNKTKFSIESSSSDEEQEVTFKENKQVKNSVVDEKVPEAKSGSTEINVNKLTAMPSSMLSIDLFETNDQSMQQSIPPTAQVPKKQQHEVTNKAASPISSDNQSDKENRSELSLENVTVVDTRQLKRRKSILSKTVENDEEEISQYKGVPAEHNKSVKNTEEQTDEIESSQKNKDKPVDHFEHESDPYFVRESLLNVTQERIAYKNIEKDLFGIDLSKIQENQIDDVPDSEKLPSPITPQRKPKNSEENDDFDSDNIEATPVARKRSTFRLPSSDSTPKSEINASQMFSPRRRPNLIPAITPMKNTKSYPLCHSTPMIECNSSERLYHTQEENIKIVCSSLTPDNTKMVHTFVEKFNAQFQNNFDVDVTHVIVKVDPETKAGPKTFKYIQGIAFKKQVVSFEWIKDCLAKNKLVDADDEKYDVLDPDGLVSGSKKSRLSSEKLFKDFAICCLEPFDKVPSKDFKEMLSYNGAAIVNSFPEFNLHKDKLKVIIVGADELDDESSVLLNKVEAAAVYFEWVVDSLSQFQILALPSYLCEISLSKVLSLGFPRELLQEEETWIEEDD